MRIRLAATALTAVLAGVLGAPGAATADVEPFIIGGNTVSSAPWAAAVFQNGNFACSGTIIAPTWVLTAAHCLGGTLSVRVGSVYRSSGGETRTVDATYFQYDMGLMRLSSPVTTQYVTLTEDDFYVLDSISTIYGWGMTCYSGCGTSEQLKTASVDVYNIWWADFSVVDSQDGPAIRSRPVDGATWLGDSGGPLFYNGEQVGVLSTGNGRTYQHHAAVAWHRSWIRSVTGV